MPQRRTTPRRGEDEIFYARSCTEGPVFDGATVVWGQDSEVVAADQSELSPAGTPSRGPALEASLNEHAPPGN
jgi:hypothetical protein